MKRLVSLTAVAFFLMAVFCFAEERATSKDAESMVKKAVEFYKASGKDKALSEFNNSNGKFADIPKGLFIFAYNFDGKCVAQGANPAMVGKVLLDMKDPDGKPVIKDLLEIAKSKGKGWYDYKWSNPANKKLETKTSYIERIDDLMIGCGFYKAL
jgi:signal transduction histidine kinase